MPDTPSPKTERDVLEVEKDSNGVAEAVTVRIITTDSNGEQHVSRPYREKLNPTRY